MGGIRKSGFVVRCPCGYEGALEEFYCEEFVISGVHVESGIPSHVDIYFKCPKCGYVCELDTVYVEDE